MTIPALMWPLSALATNKLHSTIGTGSTVLAFWRAGQVDLRAFARPTGGAFLGFVLGASLVQYVDPSLMSLFVPLLLIATGCYFLLAPSMSEVDAIANAKFVNLATNIAGLLAMVADG